MKKIIPNTQNIYCASSGGKIYKRDTEISQHMDRKINGYLQCAVKINGKYQKQKSHRLIAMAFLDLKQGTVVNHINGIKTDNRVSNLEVITHFENMQHAKELKSFKDGRKKCEKSKMKLDDLQIKELLSVCNTMSLNEMSKKFNIGQSTVSDYIKRAGITRENTRVNQIKMEIRNARAN